MEQNKITQKEATHIWLAIGCKNVKDGHLNFHIEGKKFICDNCGEDFTLEVEEMKRLLGEMVKGIIPKEVW
jgi:hypothetical protein